MVTNMIIATSFFSMSNIISWSTVGYVLIAIGLVATLLSGRRYLLFYLLGGMAYWLLVEGIQSVISNSVPDTWTINPWQSYVIALSLTWFVPSVFLAYRYVTFSNFGTSTHKSKATPNSDSYIEHTPIYNNYKPRFHN